MIEKLSKAYLSLILIFGIALSVGTVKSTVYPDETVYTPGKLVALYDAENKSFVRRNRNTYISMYSKNLMTSTVSPESFGLNNNCK